MSTRILGIVLLVIGLILVGIGWQASDSFADSVSDTVTGRFTDETMWYLIGGGVLALVGAGLAISAGRFKAIS